MTTTRILTLINFMIMVFKNKKLTDRETSQSLKVLSTVYKQNKMMLCLKGKANYSLYDMDDMCDYGAVRRTWMSR